LSRWSKFQQKIVHNTIKHLNCFQRYSRLLFIWFISQ
jgi:hypothetical protein